MAAAAALVARLFPLPGAAGGSLLPVPVLNAVAVRFVASNRGKKSLNNPRRRAARHSGLKKHDGEFVHAGNILATQRLIRWHPGAHMPATETGRTTFRTRPKTPKNPQQPLDPGRESLREYKFVGIGRNNCLYALEDGVVRFTKEVYVPHPLSRQSSEVICNLPRGAVLYKTFVNVVPKNEVGSFKLVDML